MAGGCKVDGHHTIRYWSGCLDEVVVVVEAGQVAYVGNGVCAEVLRM